MPQSILFNEKIAISQQSDEINHLRKLKEAHTARQRVLERQQATHSSKTDPAIIIELTGIEGKIQQIDEQLRQFTGLTIVRRPYKGLKTFTEEDAAIFSGRKKQVEALLKKVEQLSFLAICGPSWCGPAMQSRRRS